MASYPACFPPGATVACAPLPAAGAAAGAFSGVAAAVPAGAAAPRGAAE
jgi:hypothetical protein